MMTYRNNNNAIYYDFSMLADLLRMHPSILKKELKGHTFLDDELLKYKNRHLYSQNGVVGFILYLAERKLQTDLRKLERAVNKNND